MNYPQRHQRQSDGAGLWEKTKIKGKTHYGTTAYLLPYAAVRAIQFACLVVVLGFTANWINVFGEHHLHIPNILNVMVGFAAAAILPAILPLIAAYVGQWKVLAFFCIPDTTFLIAFSYFAYLFAPVKFVNCGEVGNQTSSVQQRYASNFMSTLSSTNNLTTQLDLWVNSSGTQCMELRATWGLCIALPILFFLSLLGTAALVYLKRDLQKGGGKRGHGYE